MKKYNLTIELQQDGLTARVMARKITTILAVGGVINEGDTVAIGKHTLRHGGFINSKYWGKQPVIQPVLKKVDG